MDCQFFAVPCLEVKENTNFPQTLLGRAKTSTKYLILLKLVVITVVSIECRRFTGFALLRYTIALKNARHYVIQSDVKPPIATCMHTNSRASRRDLIGSLKLSVSFAIGYREDFAFGLGHSVEKFSKVSSLSSKLRSKRTT